MHVRWGEADVEGWSTLLVSSRGVGRIVHSVLGGEGRLAVANGEVVEFAAVAAPGGGFALQLHRPHQVG